MSGSTIKTLVLYADYTTRLSYYDDWQDAFQAAPQFNCTAMNICGANAAQDLPAVVAEAELIVLLHSTNGDTTVYLEPFVPILQARRGLLLFFVGNEVNLPGSPIAGKREILRRIEPDFIATQLLPETGEFLFGDLARRGVLSVPHALNPAAFRPEKPQADRRIDIGVRAVRYLPHLGDDDRNRVFAFFARHDFDPSLAVDIGTARLDRAGWAAYLNDCRGTVSTEAGSWFIERDDATIEAIRRWTAETYGRGKLVIANDSPLRKLGHRLPWPVRAALRRILSKGVVRHESTVTEELPFEEVYDRFFRDRPRPAIYGKCISSRHLDAVGTKTCQIMLAGRYNDILAADEHYLALAADFSNIADVMERFHDRDYRAAMVNRAYDHVMSAHTFARRVAMIHAAVTSSAT